MKPLHDIMNDAGLVARVVGIEPPDPDRLHAAPTAPDPIRSKLEKGDVDVSGALAELTPISLFNSHVEATTDHIAELWRAVAGVRGLSFLEFSVQFWDASGGSLLYRRTALAVALAGAAGLDDSSAWAESFAPRNSVLGTYVNARKDAILSLFQTGKISIVRDFTFLSDEEFVRVCYMLVLGREPDAVGLSQYVEAVGAAGRTAIFDDISRSQEALCRKALGQASLAPVGRDDGPSIFDCLVTVLAQLTRI